MISMKFELVVSERIANISDMDGYCLVTASFATIATVIHTFIVISLVCHSKGAKDVRLVTIDVTRAVAYGLGLILSSDSAILSFYSIHVILSQICTIMFTISFVNLLIWRLHSSFRNTTFKLSQNGLILLISCPIIIVLSLIIYFVVNSLIIITLAVLVFITGIVAINYLFSYKLMKLLIPMHNLDVKSISHVNYNSESGRGITGGNVSDQDSVAIETPTSGANGIPIDSPTSGDDGTVNDPNNACTNTNGANKFVFQLEIELSEQQAPLVQLIGKHSLLTFLQSLTVILWLVSLSLNGLTHEDAVLCKDNSQMVSYIARICTALPNIIVPICIWFSFAFAKQQYYCMCGMCHALCLSQFQQIALKKIDVSIRNPKIATVTH